MLSSQYTQYVKSLDLLNSMIRSQLITVLLATTVFLALGSWSAIVAADRYQEAHQLPGATATRPIAPASPQHWFDALPDSDI
jgi:hypothetical protein